MQRFYTVLHTRESRSKAPSDALHSRLFRERRFPGMSVFMILVVLALALAIVSLLRPGWPLLPVAVILLAVALLISRQGF